MEVSKKYGLLPSGLISQLYLESNWGASYEGQTDHNWGGLTGTAQTRPSGVVVTTGNARPANEGGYYMHFASDEDFIQDYAYLLAEEVGGNNQKLYQVVEKQTLMTSLKDCLEKEEHCTITQQLVIKTIHLRWLVLGLVLTVQTKIYLMY